MMKRKASRLALPRGVVRPVQRKTIVSDVGVLDGGEAVDLVKNESLERQEQYLVEDCENIENNLSILTSNEAKVDVLDIIGDDDHCALVVSNETSISPVLEEDAVRNETVTEKIAVSCVVCDSDISHLGDIERLRHVNTCLDSQSVQVTKNDNSHSTSTTQDTLLDKSKSELKRKSRDTKQPEGYNPVKNVPKSIWKVYPREDAARSEHAVSVSAPPSKSDIKRREQIERIDVDLKRMRMEIGEIDSQVAAAQHRKTKISKHIKKLIKKQNALVAASNKNPFCISVDPCDSVIPRVFLSHASSLTCRREQKKEFVNSDSPLWSLSRIGTNFDELVSTVNIAETGIVNGIAAHGNMENTGSSRGDMLPTQQQQCITATPRSTCSPKSVKSPRSPSFLSQCVQIINDRCGNSSQNDMVDGDVYMQTPPNVANALIEINHKVSALQDIISNDSHTNLDSIKFREVLRFCYNVNNSLQQLWNDCESSLCDDISDKEIIKRLPSPACTPSCFELDLQDVIGDGSPDQDPRLSIKISDHAGSVSMCQFEVSHRQQLPVEVKSIDVLSEREMSQNEKPFAASNPEEKMKPISQDSNNVSAISSLDNSRSDIAAENPSMSYLNDTDIYMGGVVHYDPAHETFSTHNNITDHEVYRTSKRSVLTGLHDDSRRFSTDYVLSGDEEFQYDCEENNVVVSAIDTCKKVGEINDGVLEKSVSLPEGNAIGSLADQRNFGEMSQAHLPLDILSASELPDLTCYPTENLRRICEKYGLKSTGARSNIEQLLTKMWQRKNFPSNSRILVEGRSDICAAASTSVSCMSGSATQDSNLSQSICWEESILSQQGNIGDCRDVVLEFIRSNRRLYEDVLSFVPLDVNMLHKELRKSNAAVSKTVLQSILDEEGIFTLSSRGRNKNE